MANTNRPFGARPVRYLNGNPWNGVGRPYYAASTYATAFYIGDPVVIDGTSNAAEFQGFQAGTLPGLAIGVAGSPITGFVIGVQPVTRASTVYRAASTEAVVFVCDDPDVIFQVQDDGGGSLGTTTVGLNAQLISGSGSTTTGRSGWAMDGGTTTAPGSNSGYQLFIIGAANIANNDVTSDYAVWEVILNEQTFRPNVGVGI